MNVKRILGCALLGGMMVVTAACGNNSADKTITPVAQAETVNKMPNFTNAPIADEYAIFDTNYGQIKIRLYGSKAPITVKNFDYLAKKGFYNGVTFHRVIDGFMIQGGGMESGMREKATNAPIQNEANNRLSNKRGTVAMARTSDPHSATAQFFINVADNDFLNYRSKEMFGREVVQEWGYAVFGEVVEGMDVVDKIKKVKTGNKGFHQDVPTEDVVITSVSVE